MMVNLFDIFDPSTSKLLSLNWISLLLPVALFPLTYWLIPSRLSVVSLMLSRFLVEDLKNNFKSKNLKAVVDFIGLFWCIVIWNVMGLVSYVFTPTSHLVVSLSLALPFWLTLMIYGWSQFTNKMFSHTIPLGTPMALSVFMVFIETISNVIRPITLSVRLTANMIAGHLLISLLSETSVNFPVSYSVGVLFLLVLLLLELAVALIQSYVFITLTSLYMNEF